MEISYKLPTKCGRGLMNLSSSYPDLFAYKISQKFMEHISLTIKMSNLFFYYYFFIYKNGRKNKKN